MPRLRHIQSGAIVSVADEKVARMGDEWESADKPEPKKAPAKKAASPKKSD